MANVSNGSKLTKRSIDAAHPQRTRYDLWDSELRGFGLRIEASGTKTFIVRYRANGGGRSAPRRFMTIGRYGVLTAEEARKKAHGVLGAVAKGDDPAGDRSAKRREMTMTQLVDLFETEGVASLKPTTKTYMLARLRNHVIPLLGRKKLTDIRVTDVERFIRDVRAGKTAKDEKIGPRRRSIVKGGPGAAAKVVRDLSSLFSFARRLEIVAANPCEAARKPADGKRTRYLILEEVKRLGGALDKLATAGANSKAITIARLWALTGCRRDEIAALKWSEVDFEAGCLRLEESKTGRSVRALAAPALVLLAALSRKENSDFVFPSETGESFYQGTKKVWSKAIKLADLPGVTPHTLRHTLGSAAVSTGETLAMTGALLGHANQRSTAIYAHMQSDPTKRAADRVVGAIAAALAGNPSADLVPLKRIA